MILWSAARSRVHKSQATGHTGVYILYWGAQYFWALNMERPWYYPFGACNFGMAITFVNNLLTPGLDPQVVYSRMVFRPEYCMHSAFFILRPYWLFIHSLTTLGAESKLQILPYFCNFILLFDRFTSTYSPQNLVRRFRTNWFLLWYETWRCTP